MDVLDRYLDRYLGLQERLHQYFNYREGWVAIPIDDRRGCWWALEGEGPGTVHYAKKSSWNLVNGLVDSGVKYDVCAPLSDDLSVRPMSWEDDYYKDAIYTPAHLPKSVYRGAKYTMICVDTHVDGNKFLAIYENDHEVRPVAPEKSRRLLA